MQIVLRSMPQYTDGSISVGTLDGDPLYYIGRTPMVRDREMAHEDVQDALRDAVDVCCEALWGSEWSGPLSVSTSLNRRSCSKDRVWKHGLPPWVLRFLGEAAAQPSPRALGDFLCGIARIYDADRLKKGVEAHRPPPTRDEIAHVIKGRLMTAVDLMQGMRTDKQRARAKSQSEDTNY